MISPELLRRYPFFARLDDKHLKQIAMLADEVAYAQSESLFEIDDDARALFFLVEGSVELHYVVTNPDDPGHRKDFYMGHINPGEPFGISALIDPHRFTAMALANRACRVIEIEAEGLRALCEKDCVLDATLMHHVAKAAMSRLHETRIQLIAARA